MMDTYLICLCVTQRSGSAEYEGGKEGKHIAPAGAKIFVRLIVVCLRVPEKQLFYTIRELTIFFSRWKKQTIFFEGNLKQTIFLENFLAPPQDI